MNRIDEEIERVQDALDEQLKLGKITKEQIDITASRLNLTFEEHFMFQEAKSEAQMNGFFNLEEAMTIYSFLGHSPNTFNQQAPAVKMVLTIIFHGLMKKKVRGTDGL